MDKKLTLIWVPAFASLYFIIAELSNSPYTAIVLGILAIFSTILGIRLYFKQKYYDGLIVVNKSEKGKLFSLEIAGEPEDLEVKESVRFKIVSNSE